MTERDLEQSMKIDIKLDVFEGPLDLLLHLIEKNKVSIYDIPIVEITNQYMEYIREMDRWLYHKLRYSVLGRAANLPGRAGRKMFVAAYKVCQKFYGFN